MAAAAYASTSSGASTGAAPTVSSIVQAPSNPSSSARARWAFTPAASNASAPSWGIAMDQRTRRP